jgi:hypothetical protein
MRVAVVLAAVDALVRGGRLTLTSLGRRLESSALPKHRIKRIDRLLGNGHLHQELPLWYGALTRRLLGQARRPIVLIDWTQTVGEFNALVAAVPFIGRAIPIYAEVHPSSKLGNRKVQEKFLDHLADVLPKKARPVIVADGGFRTPFFKTVMDRQWDFVIRLRGGALLRQRTSTRRRDPRMSFDEAFSRATEHPQRLGHWYAYANSTMAGNVGHLQVVLGARPEKRRMRSDDRYYETRALEPWLLATTLEGEHPNRIVRLYAMRMQIEQTFRDAKNARFGWALEHANSRQRNRQAVLLLLGCLSLAATLLTGAAVEDRGDARRFQANTIRSRRVQSLFHLGVFVLALAEPISIPIPHIISRRKALAKLTPAWFQLRLPLTTYRCGKWV